MALTVPAILLTVGITVGQAAALPLASAPQSRADYEVADEEPTIVFDVYCPENPPPPQGWKYWKGPVNADEMAFAVRILHDPATYPVGSFVQEVVAGRLLTARVEWHTWQGETGKRGCFRGVNLLKPTDQAW